MMDISESSIAAIVQEVCSHVQVPEQDYDKSLKDLGVDSLDVAGIFLAVHEKFDVRVPDDQIDHLTTVRQIAAYLNKHI